MNKDLEAINQLYESFQNYIDPTAEFLKELTEATWQQFQEQSENYTQQYLEARSKLMKIIITLEPRDIAEAYEFGCRLLQRNLSGYMGENFSQEYMLIMENAITSKHYHTAWLFLQVLADNLKEQSEPSMKAALALEPLQATALHIVGQLKLMSLLPEVRELTNSDDEEIREAAHLAIRKLES